MRKFSALIAVGVLGGCVADEATSSTEQFAKCPEWGCGENSPLTGPFNLRELYFRDPNVDNGNHMRLWGFQKVINGTLQTYDVNVVKDRVKALYTGTTDVALENEGLVNGWFLLTHDAAEGYPPGVVRVKIVSIDNQAFWQPPSGYVQTYELAYNGVNAPSSEFLALCNRPLPGTGIRDTARDPAENHLWKNRFNSIIFSGDRYSEAYTVSAGTRALSWMNIACAGSVTAKLHLNRHTTASQAPGYVVNTLTQRQAMLKMYSGDFCGSGNAYTRKGTPIHWNNKTGLNSGAGNDTAFESMWSGDGAMCLQTHRLASSLVDEENEMGEEIIAECDLPLCTDIPDYTNYNLYGQYLMTLSPQ
jgi:hypothetical protein